MVLDILKAILAGVCAALPVGPVLILTARRILVDGRKAGLLCGVGTAVADTLYTTLAIFALGFISGFMERYEANIYIVGFILLTIIGMIILRKKIELGSGKSLDKINFMTCSVPTALAALSNPGSLAYIIALVAVLGLNREMISAPLWAIVAAVFAGEIIYWSVISRVIDKYVRVGDSAINVINKIVGVAICLFGVALLVKGLIILI